MLAKSRRNGGIIYSSQQTRLSPSVAHINSTVLSIINYKVMMTVIWTGTFRILFENLSQNCIVGTL
jgi:hypothetical protein